MLEFNNVTIKNKSQVILYCCSIEIDKQSIILTTNDIDSKIIAKSMTGLSPIESGDISLSSYLTSPNIKSSQDLFYIITENSNKFWRNYRIKDIASILFKKNQESHFLKKYNIKPESSIKSLSNFQRLVHHIHIGILLGRKIFIFDQPTKFFDYKDLEKFHSFLINDLRDFKYIILSNRFDEMFKKVSNTIYEINAQSIKLKGGDKYDS